MMPESLLGGPMHIISPTEFRLVSLNATEVTGIP